MSDVTRVIQAVIDGQADAHSDLLPLVYHDLKQIARRKMSDEKAGHTLQPTALVHEAYLRLVGPGDDSWENRAHFFAAAAEAMRRILVDHARSRKWLKRGGEFQRVELTDVSDSAMIRGRELLALDDALGALELIDKQKAELVKLKFFGGLTTHQAGELLGFPPRTADRHWAFARAWLFRYVHEEE